MGRSKSSRRCRKSKTASIELPKKRGKKCKICQKDDHRTKSCPRSLCEHCGFMKGHHTNLGNSSLCSNLTNRVLILPEDDDDDFCDSCKQTGHISKRCPNIWRIYISKKCESENYQKGVIPMHTIFCYNCAQKGHYGDDCQVIKQHNRKRNINSAFSGNNLSTKLKEKYYSYLDDVNDEDNVTSKLEIKSRKNPNISYFFPPPYKNLRQAEFLNEEYVVTGLS